MGLSNRFCLLWLAFCTSSTIADSFTYSVSQCVSGSPVTAFTDCVAAFNDSDSCSSMAVTNSDPMFYPDCYCNQRVLNNIYGCQSEVRLCLEGPWDDNEWESWESSWFSFCDQYITYVATTPPISTIPTTFFFDYCTLGASACDSATVGLDECQRTIASSDQSKLSSCYCQPEFLSLAYSCEYLGNVSCLQTGATLSSVWGYSYCQNFQSVIGTGISSPPLTTVSLHISSSTSLAAQPGSTTTSSSATKTPTAPLGAAASSKGHSSGLNRPSPRNASLVWLAFAAFSCVIF